MVARTARLRCFLPFPVQCGDLPISAITHTHLPHEQLLWRNAHDRPVSAPRWVCNTHDHRLCAAQIVLVVLSLDRELRCAVAFIQHHGCALAAPVLVRNDDAVLDRAIFAEKVLHLLLSRFQRHLTHEHLGLRAHCVDVRTPASEDAKVGATHERHFSDQATSGIMCRVAYLGRPCAPPSSAAAAQDAWVVSGRQRLPARPDHRGRASWTGAAPQIANKNNCGACAARPWLLRARCGHIKRFGQAWAPLCDPHQGSGGRFAEDTEKVTTCGKRRGRSISFTPRPRGG
eukprot:351479-Chlamydomonas_euryale.AAC.7